MRGFSKALKALLTHAGWRFHRQAKGDHEIWIDPSTGRTVAVDNSCRSRHTANDILKKAGLPKAF